MIKSDKIESIYNMMNANKGCKILVTNLVDDCKGSITGKIYAISMDRSSCAELKSLCNKLCDDGEDAVVIGFYE